MNDRERELRALADRLTERESVVDAWTAKSFTDRLFVLEMATGVDVAADVEAVLADHGLCGYNEVHDIGVEEAAFAGHLDRGDRYQYVDIHERGELQSYVIE